MADSKENCRYSQFHLCSDTRKNKCVYDYDHSTLLWDPAPPPEEQQEIVNVIRGETGHLRSVSYSVRGFDPFDSWMDESSSINSGQRREWSFWRKCVSPSSYGIVYRAMTAAASGTAACTRSFWNSMRSKLSWPTWPCMEQSGQHWVLKIVQFVCNKGMQVNYITEIQCESEEVAEMYARKWDHKMDREQSQIPYTVQIFKVTGDSDA